MESKWAAPISRTNSLNAKMRANDPHFCILEPDKLMVPKAGFQTVEGCRWRTLAFVRGVDLFIGQ
jgi:hypothetical protein